MQKFIQNPFPPPNPPTNQTHKPKKIIKSTWKKKKTQKFKINTAATRNLENTLQSEAQTNNKTQPMIIDLTNQPITPIIWNPHKQIRPPVTTTVTNLGMTNLAVAMMEGGKSTIVMNAEGQRMTPFMVAYAKNGDMLVGQIAKRQAVMNLKNMFFLMKRFIGRKMTEVDE